MGYGYIQRQNVSKESFEQKKKVKCRCAAYRSHMTSQGCKILNY